MCRTNQTGKCARAWLAMSFAAGSVLAQDVNLDSPVIRTAQSKPVAAHAHPTQMARPQLTPALPAAPITHGLPPLSGNSGRDGIGRL